MQFNIKRITTYSKKKKKTYILVNGGICQTAIVLHNRGMGLFLSMSSFKKNYDIFGLSKQDGNSVVSALSAMGFSS